MDQEQAVLVTISSKEGWKYSLLFERDVDSDQDLFKLGSIFSGSESYSARDNEDKVASILKRLAQKCKIKEFK